MGVLIFRLLGLHAMSICIKAYSITLMRIVIILLQLELLNIPRERILACPNQRVQVIISEASLGLLHPSWQFLRCLRYIEPITLVIATGVLDATLMSPLLKLLNQGLLLLFISCLLIYNLT